jgi:hypothetical protein
MSDYDVDFYAWTQRQGALLRRLAAGERLNDADLDWPNIAEEIETLGRSERGAIASHITNIIEHLVKLETSPARDPRAGWKSTIRRSRIRVQDLLEDSPSLRRLLPVLVSKAVSSGRRLAEISLTDHGDVPTVDLQSLTYTPDQVLGDWFPDEPQ